ncbi:hypothetical protein PAL_GLEAN10019379 [Pteropus alecto]|uniref:Uncharacterized protein n=1 Tax=Pteropus alecto TaxID=9402 RepID=L5JSZ0_PTEAL|nr:hypothetical protein PAL_GLEAN10019379 [Pteropus alecto]
MAWCGVSTISTRVNRMSVSDGRYGKSQSQARPSSLHGVYARGISWIRVICFYAHEFLFHALNQPPLCVLSYSVSH